MTPPKAAPLLASRKASEAMPAVGVPPTIGVSATVQDRPRSVVFMTRAEASAPVPTHAVPSPCVTRQVPLAAKLPSPSLAGGRRSGGTRAQIGPPA